VNTAPSNPWGLGAYDPTGYGEYLGQYFAPQSNAYNPSNMWDEGYGNQTHNISYGPQQGLVQSLMRLQLPQQPASATPFAQGVSYTPTVTQANQGNYANGIGGYLQPDGSVSFFKGGDNSPEAQAARVNTGPGLLDSTPTAAQTPAGVPGNTTAGTTPNGQQWDGIPGHPGDPWISTPGQSSAQQPGGTPPSTFQPTNQSQAAYNPTGQDAGYYIYGRNGGTPYSQQ
jgi:hypothetical protein